MDGYDKWVQVIETRERYGGESPVLNTLESFYKGVSQAHCWWTENFKYAHVDMEYGFIDQGYHNTAHKVGDLSWYHTSIVLNQSWWNKEGNNV